MSRRPLIALLVLVALVAPACSGEGGAAFSVAGREFSHDDLFDELDALEANEAFRSALQVEELAEPRGDTERSYRQAFIRWVIEARIFFTFVEDEFERRDLELTDDERVQSRDSFVSFDFETGEQLTGQQVLSRFPAAYRTRWIDDQARLTKLQGSFESLDAFSEWVGTTAREADVEINSRYGHWDAENLTVVPPAGPVTTSTTVDPALVP